MNTFGSRRGVVAGSEETLMHKVDPSRWRDNHDFNSVNPVGERGTRLVVLLTATMAGEIIAGWLTNSMALLADGWHMGTHVAVLSVIAFATR
jgi:Co/Zn/Cd efflux system component